MTTYDEDRIAEILRRLPPAPDAWVTAAQVLPEALRGLDTLVERAEQDAAFRATLLADLEAALTAAGVDPRPAVVRHLRRRLQA